MHPRCRATCCGLTSVQAFPLMSYGDEWRAQRKLAHSALNQKAVQKYHVVQEDLAASLAARFLDTPQDFFYHLKLCVPAHPSGRRGG